MKYELQGERALDWGREQYVLASDSGVKNASHLASELMDAEPKIGATWSKRGVTKEKMEEGEARGGIHWVLGTLPALMAIPSMFLSSRVSLVGEEADMPGMVGRTATLVFLAVVFALLVRSMIRLQFFGAGGRSGACGQLGTVQIVVVLALVYMAANLVSVTRACVVAFGLYLDRWNPYTFFIFLCDIYLGFGSGLWRLVLVGYGLLVGAHSAVHRKLRPLAVVSLFASLDMFILTAVASLSALIVIFFFLEDLSISLVGVNICSSVVFLISLQDCSLRVLHWNPLLLSCLSLLLEHVVLSPMSASKIYLLLKAVLPAIIRVDKSSEEKIEDFNSPLKPGHEHSSKSIMQQVISHAETRAIFNFLLLNATFMFIQFLYSFRSKSLGLLSDSLHMALDCTSLALGLVASVLLKKEIDSNSRFPFGLRNFETLAGFTNATLLIGISANIIFDAIGRLIHPIDLQKTTELIIVSFLGLLVNLVGIFAFNHGHAHGHSHSHGGGHSHRHDEGHSHSHSDSHTHSHSCTTDHLAVTESHDHSTLTPKPNSHKDDGMSDNMRGIFLHVLADTLGSVSVVISTLLTKLFPWSGFDPIASIFIAVLIFASAVPLIKSSALGLLLKVSSEKEIKIRSALHDVLQVRGVKSYTTPRFWPSGDSSEIQGYIHIQIYRGENSMYIKSQCENIFKTHGIKTILQIESDFESCWCRTESAMVAS